jgi:hypothetical protein
MQTKILTMDVQIKKVLLKIIEPQSKTRQVSVKQEAENSGPEYWTDPICSSII